MRNSIRKFQSSLPRDYSFQSSRSVDELTGAAACCFAFCTCCTCLVLALFVAFIIVMGISKLVFGGLYFHNCPLEPRLPIYLLVSALVPITFQFCCQWCKKNAPKVYLVGALLLFLFNIAWLASGTVFYVEAKKTLDTCEESSSPLTPETSTVIPAGNMTTPLLQETEDDTTCLTCNEKLMTFTLVSIILDWILNGLYVCVIGGGQALTALHLL